MRTFVSTLFFLLAVISALVPFVVLFHGGDVYHVVESTALSIAFGIGWLTYVVDL